VCVFEYVDALRTQFDGQRAQSLKVQPRSLEEVLVMASYLGLPYGRTLGVEHLWIADAALCPALPIGWVVHDAPHTHEPFYQNLWSGEVMWEHPQIAFLRGAVAAINGAATAASTASAAALEILEARTLRRVS